MKIALAQINTTVGDLDGNRDRIVAADRRGARRGRRARRVPGARDHGLSAGGPPAPPRLRPRGGARPPRQVAQAATGHRRARRAPHAEDGRLYNACLVCADGVVSAVYRKRLLPNYGVFDEKRYFEPGTDVGLLELRRMRRSA